MWVRDGVQSAPIGAEVFTFERLKHSRTRVYGYHCPLDPVDTCSAADKLKKSKNSFNFDGFEALTRSRSSIEAPIRSIGQALSEEGKEEGMSGLPVMMIRGIIGSPGEPGARQRHITRVTTFLNPSRAVRARAHGSRHVTLSAASRSSPPPQAAHPIGFLAGLSIERFDCAALLGSPSASKAIVVPQDDLFIDSLSVFAPFSVTSPVSPEALRSQLPSRSARPDIGKEGIEGSERTGMDLYRIAAQPLQVSLAKSWDGRSTPQELAGRVHSRGKHATAKKEETAR